MNLKKQYQRLFEGRQAFAKMNSLVTNDALLEGPPTKLSQWSDEKQELGGDHPSGFDYKYFIEQTESLIETLEEFEQEIGTNLEMKADDTGETYWKQTENQTSRYIMGAHKQLEGLLKKLQTGESRVAPGTYKIPGA